MAARRQQASIKKKEKELPNEFRNGKSTVDPDVDFLLQLSKDWG